MKELLKYTEEFKLLDSQNLVDDFEFQILISHDNSKTNIKDKFTFEFLNSEYDKINEINSNYWTINKIEVVNYFDRAKIRFNLNDSKSKTSNTIIESGGFSLSSKKELNISCVRTRLTNFLFEFKLLSCFIDYNSNLRFTQLIKEKYPNFEMGSLNYF